MPFLWSRDTGLLTSQMHSPHLGEGIYSAEESRLFSGRSSGAQVNSRGAEKPSFVKSQRWGRQGQVQTCGTNTDKSHVGQELSLCVLGDHILSVVTHHSESVLNVS